MFVCFAFFVVYFVFAVLVNARGVFDPTGHCCYVCGFNK